MGRGEVSVYKWSRSHEQDDHRVRIWKIPSKIFSYKTNFHMIMKLGMEYYVLNLYKVYINDDTELTLTYFTILSNLAKPVFVLIVGSDIR